MLFVRWVAIALCGHTTPVLLGELNRLGNSPVAVVGAFPFATVKCRDLEESIDLLRISRPKSDQPAETLISSTIIAVILAGIAVIE